jgi:tRNA uridine 5-carboxymethylaminomethyl modification enzyme
MRIFNAKMENVNFLKTYLAQTFVTPETINAFLEEVGTSPIKQKCSLKNLIERPQVTLQELVKWNKDITISSNTILTNIEAVFEYVENEIKYSGYMDRERIIADKLIRLEKLNINDTMNYSEIDSLSTEAKQKLKRIKPKTIGQAARVPGVSPSDINVLLIHMGR